MKIIRDGKEYELTRDEIMACYFQERLRLDLQDIKYIIKKKKKWQDLYNKLEQDENFAKEFALKYRYFKNKSFADEEWSCMTTAYDYRIGKFEEDSL